MTQLYYEMVVVRCDNCGKEERNMSEVKDTEPQSFRLERWSRELEEWEKELKAKGWTYDTEKDEHYCTKCGNRKGTGMLQRSNR